MGSSKAEFHLPGAPFAGPGARADDARRAIRASFAPRVPSYKGTVFESSGFVVEPSGVQAQVPIWVGGRPRRSLVRALELGDGWIPFGLPVDDLETMGRTDDAVEALAVRSEGFDIVLVPEPPIDPIGDAEAAVASQHRPRPGRRQLAEGPRSIGRKLAGHGPMVPGGRDRANVSGRGTD